MDARWKFEKDGGLNQSRILLVDDDPLVRELGAMIIRHLGHLVATAGNGLQALECLQSDPGTQFDLLITDLTMPGMDGHELIREVRRRSPQLPIIICSGFSEKAVVDPGGSTSPRITILPKPYTVAAMGAKIAVALGAKPAQMPLGL